MVSSNVYSYTAAAGVILASVAVLRRRRAPKKEEEQPRVLKQHPLAGVAPEQLPRHIQDLLAELPGCVILQSDVEVFQEALDRSWAQPNREIIPACIVRPHDVRQLSKAVAVLKREHDGRSGKSGKAGEPAEGLFAVRSGALNPGLAVAAVQDGVVIDLSKLCEVTPSADRATVTLGAGAKWIDVHRKLEETGLAVLGGRSSPAGVGGLVLQGGISFYSGRFGFICSNVLSYEVVLADGSIVTASASENPDLWRVLKGGGNNFGIVTRFTLPTLPAAPLWFMQMIAPASFQQHKALRAYHDYLAGASDAFDEEAGCPILSFAHINGLPVHLMAVQLAYTRAPQDDKWPALWRETGFPSIWSFTNKGEAVNQTIAVEANAKYSPPGTRHTQGATTVRNDLETMKAAYGIFCQTMAGLKDIKGFKVSFTFQAILPGWYNKGDPNILGLEGCNEPLIIVHLSNTWPEAKDDQRIRAAVQAMLEQIEAMAAAKKTGHPYRFINYCMEWQRPYDGCGEKNLKLMREASSKYDPEGLFQTGCAGGFKIPTV